MASNISLEIGSHSIRAAISNNGKVESIPLGYSASPYSCPSVTINVSNDIFLFGDYAKNWVFNKPDCFYHISDIEAGSVLLGKVYSSLFQFILERVQQCGWEKPLSCTVIIPSYYAVSDPRKKTIENAARQVGLSSIYFQYDSIAICSKRASISDEEYVLVFDLGYSGLSMSIVQRHNGRLDIVNSVRNTTVSGRAIDGVIIEDIEKKSIANRSTDLFASLLLTNEIAMSAEHIKEELSFKENTVQSVITGEYFISRKNFTDMIAPLFTSVLQSCKEVLDSSKVKYTDIHQLILCGGCSNIPFVSDLLIKHFVGNGNGSVRLSNFAKLPGYNYDACLGAFYSNYSSSLSF